ncbi:MAG: F0F1 ATP synthase subunit A [Chloroflexi bacterium]|nr:F0F1 ATP synthase subunit A [Chloroflexota bacterium]
MGSGAKRFTLLAIIFVFALFVAGLMTGAIGAVFYQSDEDKEAGLTAEGPFIPKPEVHLPAQTVFPKSEREYYLEFLEAEEKERELGEEALSDHERALVDDGPFRGNFTILITNTLLSSWLASLLLILLFVLGARKAKLVPGRLQTFVELAIEGLLKFVEGVVGRQRARMLFPVIATIFLFVMFNAWIGLLPIYPALGFMTGDHIQIHLLRPAGTDMNMPLALALVSFVFVEYLGFRMLGIGYLTKFVRIGSLKRGVVDLVRLRFLGAFQNLLDFFFVGPLEAFSELVRLISFTFRLFGNMTAGEILVLVSAFLVPFIATIGVYGLELLVGFIQALIFAGLTLVFAAIAMIPHDAEAH